MTATNALISQRRYVEAAELLERNMARDIRLKNQQELLQRSFTADGAVTDW